MKFVRFAHEQLGLRVGVLEEGEKTVRPLPRNYRCVSQCIGAVPEAEEGRVSLDSAILLAPFADAPRNLFCVGKNYLEHAREFSGSGYEAGATLADAQTEHPAIFTKPQTSIAGPGELIELHPEATDSVDYEGELALVIGKAGRNIAKEDAWSHVWGYVIVNDVTARDRQRNHKQWFIGKALDGFCPMGPWVATADEVDAQNLELRTHVNGELRQSANTRDLIFDIPTLIAVLSQGLTLLPGDILLTGTPAGVGLGFQPPKFLRDGDEVSISITGLGTLTNRFTAGRLPAT